MARRFARIATEEGGEPLHDVIAPLGRLGDLPLLTKPFRISQREELAAAGLVIGEKIARDPGAPELVIGAGTWINAAAADALLRGSPEGGGRLVLRAAGWSRLAGGPLERAVDAAVVPAGTPATAATRAALPAVVLDADERAFAVARGPESLDVPAPRLVACDVRTWADLLWLNLFAMTARVRNLSPAKGAAMVAWGALRALSLNPWRVAGKLVERGKGCDVHPSAVVEASVLGEGVRIGPGAVVRGSLLAAGAEVEELALVVGSAIGARARVQRQGMVKFSVLANAASSGGTVQLSFFGEGASLRGGSYTIDRNLDASPVRVAGADGRLVDAGLVLGIALGPRASVGSGVWIGAGRAVPADVTVIRSPADTVLRVATKVPPGVYAVVDGTLVPVPGVAAPKEGAGEG